jgi:hypothetical protein
MKKLALVILAGISFATANAQIQIGAKAGINLATLNGSDAGNAGTIVNVHFGGFARIPLVEKLSLQPELLYSAQGGSYSNPNLTEHDNYLNIPVLLKYAVVEGFAIETGPQFGILLAAHNKFDGNSLTIKNNRNDRDFAWVVGASYRIPATKFGIDARYNFGIANIENRDQTHSNGSIRNGVFQLGATYVLFSAGK